MKDNERQMHREGNRNLPATPPSTFDTRMRALGKITLEIGLGLLFDALEQKTQSPVSGVVYDASFSVSPVNQEVAKPASPFSPAQQDRLTVYEHLSRMIDSFKQDIDEGKHPQFYIYTENSTQQTIPVTDRLFNRWESMASNLEAALETDPHASLAIGAIQEKLAAEKSARQAEKEIQKQAEVPGLNALWERSKENL